MFNRQKLTQASYLSDESKMTGRADNLIVPYDESELRDAVRYANTRGIHLTVRGMGTGLCGGSVPNGGDVLSLERMSGIIGVGKDRRGYYLRVLPCTTIDEINEALRKRDYSGWADLSTDAVKSLTSEGREYFYPVDPTELGGSIGGNIATNASGPRTYSYGPTRDWVRRIRVVLPEGNFMVIRRGEFRADGWRMSFPSGRNYYSFELPHYEFNTKVKNAAGPMIGRNMDLMDLFIGSEGIFGIITEADIRIMPRVPTVSNIVFFPTDADALSAVKAIREDGLVKPEFLEYMDHGSLDLIRNVMSSDPALIRAPMLPDSAGSALFFDMQLSEDMDARYSRLAEILASRGSSLDDSWCGHELEDMRRMRELRHSIPKSIFEYVASLKQEMPSIHKMGTDMSVPDGFSDEMMSFYRERLEAEGLPYVIFGHIGDNHPHVEIILRSMEDFEKAKAVYSEFARKAVELGGSPSAEHGIGKIKTGYLEMMYGSDGVAALRNVKRVLDPNGILCPGNMVGDLR